MTSQIQYDTIDATYPIAGQDNDTQGFRSNFYAIKTALNVANNELTDLQTVTDTLSNDLTNEIDRATSNESAIIGSLLVETTRALSAESTISASLNTEISRAIAVDDSLQTQISDEILRATATELSLSGNIVSEQSRAISAETSLQSQLNAEITRATNSELSLSGSIVTEQSRAISVENTLQSQLNAEITRATASELSLSGSIVTEYSRAISAETSLQSQLTAEIYRAIASESSLSTTLSDEHSRAISAENSIQSQLNFEVIRANNAELAITNSLLSEASRAQAAENSLAYSLANIGNVFKYINTVSGSDQSTPTNLTLLSLKNAGDYYKVAVAGWFTDGVNTFYAQLNDGLIWNLTNTVDIIDNTNSVVFGTSNYITVNGSSDVGFTVDIDTQFKNRVGVLEAGSSSQTSLSSSIITSIDNEISRAQAAESTLNTQLLDEINRAINSEQTLSSTINAEITRASSAESTLTAALNAEITRASSSEQSLQSSIIIETSRAQAAESSLLSAIIAETSRAQSAESGFSSVAGDLVKFNYDNTGRLISNVVTASTAESHTISSSLSIDVAVAEYQQLTITNDCAISFTNWSGNNLYNKIRLEFENTQTISPIVWQASTSYTKGQLISHDGNYYWVNGDHTSGLSFDPLLYSITYQIQNVDGSLDTESIVTFNGTIKSSIALPLVLPSSRITKTVVDVWSVNGTTIFVSHVGYFI